MSLSIRWKLLGSYLLLLLIMGGGLFLYLNRSLDEHLVAGVRTNLRSEAGLAALLVEGGARDLRRDAQELATKIGERLHARVTLIATDGKVLGDSGLTAAALANAENHGERPEVREALQRGDGSAIRYSTTVKSRMLYVAVRLDSGDTPTGVLRLALPLTAVDAAKTDLHASLAVAFLLATLLALGLSLVLAQMSSRRIETLCAGARRFGNGDFRTRIAVESHDELGTLALTMNRMAQQLQQQLEHLASERNRLDAILRGMGEGLLVVGPHGETQLVNPAFRTLFDIDGEIVGRPLIELSRHPELNQTCRDVLTTQRESSREVVLASGRTLLTHWVPLREEHAVIGVIAVFHDISDLKRLERIRRDFIANVSHELRTPVTVIGGYAETLANGLVAKEPATAERFAGIIRTHAERLTALIGDLLTLSQLEAGGFTLHLTPTPLGERIRRSCSLLEPKAAAKGVRFDLSRVAELSVMADPQRLEQILVNLLDNAVKFTPPGGEVRIATAADDGIVRLDISDNGPGIPAEALPRLFERFYRVDSGRSRAEGGTGLGLAIVKHLVQLHGGSVAVASTPGEGSTFSVRLKQAAAPCD